MPTDVVSDNRIGCFFCFATHRLLIQRIGCSFLQNGGITTLQYTQAECVLYATYAFRMVRRHKDSKPWLSHGHRHHSRKRTYS